MYKTSIKNSDFNRQTILKSLMIMKIVILLLTVSFFQVSATSFAQKVTINFKKASLERVLVEIQVQTGYDFLYNSSLIKNIELVDLDFKNTDLKTVLDACLDNRELTFEIDKQTVLIKRKPQLTKNEVTLSSQQTELSGRVTDQNGNSLEAVTVRVKGTEIGTTTNANGEYKLSSQSPEGILVFTTMSYEAVEMKFSSSSSSLNISLKDMFSDLEEVVVVGYGTQKKINLTGAVSQIKGDDIAVGSATNVVTALQGLLPGLNIQLNNGDPTGTPDINVRGFNSINGGSPLVLVDGIEGNIMRVNPLDIESVSVLKDAASAAIYGARGAFGVILITTKTGKAGDMVVNYSNNFAWTTPTTRTDFITDPYLYGKTIDAALYGYNGTSYTGYNDMDWETIRLVSKGEIEPFHELQANGTNKFFYKTDWYNYLFKKWQPSNYHNVSVSGGSDKLKAYLSGRVSERQTIQNIVDADVDRYNLKASLTFKVNDWLELSNSTRFTHEIDEDFGGYRSGYGGLWSTTTWYDMFPFLPNKIDGVPIDIGRNGTGGQGGAAAVEDGNNWRKFNTEELTNTFGIKVNPLKNLQFNLDYSNLIDNTSRTYRYNQFEYIYNNRLDVITDGVNRLGEWRWKENYKALNIFGTYSFDLAEAHNFKMLLGYNQEEFDRDRIAAQSDDLLVRDLANLALGTEMRSIEGSALLWAVQGGFGRFNYDYKEKYLLEINARYDGSSRFPRGTRWGFFPSISAGWQLNREDFWEPLENTVSSMKLRASYGKLGNQSVGVNTFQQLMNIGRSNWLDNGDRINYAGAPGPLPNVVTWESTKSINVGVDLGFLQNRLLATIDVYNKDVEGMYLPGEPLPSVFGAAEPRENYASLRNKGFELSLNYNDRYIVGGSPMSLSATISVSNSKGIITKYNNPEGLMGSYWEGQELGQIWGYRTDGQFQSDEEAAAYQASFDNPSTSLGNVYNDLLNIMQNSEWSKLKAGDIKYLDINGDGRIDRGAYTLDDHGDLEPIGNAMPKFPFGFNISASWKGFDLSAAGAGVIKQNWYPTGEIYWGTYWRPYLSFLRKDLVDNAWTPEGQGRYPQIERGYAALDGAGFNRSLYVMNDYYLENVGFLRVKNLTVGYTLPTTLTQKARIQKLRVFFSGENLLTWSFGNLTKYIDPEQAGAAINYSSPGSAVGRAYVNDYPIGKTYSIGINLTL